MISAEKARELSGCLFETYTDFISKKIESSANLKQRSVVIKDRPYCDWLYSCSAKTDISEKVIKKLEENGFKVSLYYQELQFVDYGLKIEW